MHLITFMKVNAIQGVKSNFTNFAINLIRKKSNVHQGKLKGKFWQVL